MDNSVRVKLAEMENALVEAPVRKLLGSRGWADDMPIEAGVYVIWEVVTRNPVYVGETSALRSRMRDIGRSVNHTFRRKAAKLLNIDSNNEVALSAVLAERYVVSFIEVQLGRAELEEFLILRWRKTMLNKPAKRLLSGKHYNWVESTTPRFRGVER